MKKNTSRSRVKPWLSGPVVRLPIFNRSTANWKEVFRYLATAKHAD